MHRPFSPIAIVGRACLLPGASSPEDLWNAVANGTDLISAVPSDRWGMASEDVMCDAPEDSADRTWSDRGGYVRGFEDAFDPEGFALPAREVAALDPVFQWTLHTARQALRDAGRAEADAVRYGAIFGNLSFPSAGMAAYSQALSLAAIPGFEQALGPARVAVPDPRNRFSSGLPALLLERALGLGAGAFALDAACASSLYAVKLACDRLADGDADLMLAGAVNCADDLCIHLGFAALRALSRSGRSRPFHRDADGLVPAEGCGFVALRRLDDALRDGDPIHGVIRGVGLSNDGRGRGLLVPSADGQVRAMRRALDLAGLGARDVSLLECHATGTQAGDATEVQSSAEVYADCSGLPIGSLKSNVGHLIATAGVAALIKVVEAMRHEVLPPTLHVDAPLDVLAASPFRLLTRAEAWDRESTSDGILRAGVSAFGFGGNNAHLIVEEPGSASVLARDPRFAASNGAATARPAAAVAVVGVGVSAGSAVGRQAFTDALLQNAPCLDEAGKGRMPTIALPLREQRFPPNDLKAALAQQLAIVQAAAEAVEASGTLPGASTGVYVGMGTDPEAARFGVRWRIATLAREWGCSAEWVEEARRQIGPALDAAGVVGTMPNVVANRLNSQCDLCGPSFTVSSEERSGLDALVVAARALRAREIDAAVVGAVDMSCDPVHRAAAAALLPSDRQAPGDAAVALVLKRLDDAERDGNTVFAVLPGGRFDDAGSPIDDGADLRLGVGTADQSLCHLFGHAHAASGLLHVAAAVLALHHRVAPGDVPLLASNAESGTGLPVGAGPRTASVTVAAMDGIGERSIFLAEAAGHPAPARFTPPRLHVFSGERPADVLADLASGHQSTTGSARLVIVAESDEQLAERTARARRHIEDGFPPGEGVHFRERPIDGELAFVFTAAGAGYHSMGVELLRAIPELVDPISSNFPVGEVAGWIFDASHDPTPSDYLWGTAMLSQAHARLTRDLLRLVPDAAIGYSSGESNSLYAFGIWSDMDAMRREIEASGLMERELGVEFAAIARAWGVGSAQWAMWNALAPVAEVEEAIAGEPRVHLAIVNTGDDVVIGGDASACERVVETIGRRRCRPVAYNLACHVPEVAASFHRPWLDIHTRNVTSMPGLRLYSNGPNSSYVADTATCAEAITMQAERTLEFPATIRAAYADGVRVFVEHGPGGACTNFIRAILRDRDIVAVHLDRRDRSISQVFEATAALVAAGVDVDHGALTRRLTVEAVEPRVADGPILSVPSHPAAVTLPALPSEVERAGEGDGAADSFQLMAPAPRLPPVLAEAPTERPPVRNPPARVGTPVGAMDEASRAAVTIGDQMSAVIAIHRQFVQQQSAVHEQFLATRRYGLGAPTTPSPRVAVDGEPARRAAPVPLTPVEERRSTADLVFTPSGPVFDRQQLEIHSSGRISDLFGPLFRAQDDYEQQCRMPEPPLLLADRVVGVAAECGVLGQGTIWTQTDVERDSWYLNGGYMPAGFMIEAGQADLMLISFMGIDLLNQGERVYRLLGCTLTYHGDLPAPHERLEYEIRITGHARHGDVRLFFFEYDCISAGRRRLTVRDGQAGFFSRDELEHALGVLWTPEEGLAALSPDDRVDPPAVECTKSAFGKDEVVAFSEGRVLECFGPGYEWAETHTRTPKIQAGRQLFIDRVPRFEPRGGPWQRGFMRCETTIASDAWFFDGHFKNDPCMPGNFMVEACIQAMSFYLAALGYTTRRDGWRFQPLPEHPFELKCRGEINPRTELVAYEVHVAEIRSGPHPTIIGDVVGYVDGQLAFHAHRIGVELTPGWPLTSMPELYENVVEPVAVATDGAGFAFDWKAMIACAWGKPSDAFGSMFEAFDDTRRPPRLPGPPYHFISRVTSIEGRLGECTPGMEIVSEYDIPTDAWYFDENGAETMPFAVLLEVALQPCGWVATAVGSTAGEPDDLLFRNLDGTGVLLEQITRTAGTLRTRVKLTSVSRAGDVIIEGFDVECSVGDRRVYTMETVFGFFPPEAFEKQVGLVVTDGHREQLALTGGTVIDLTERPARFCAGALRLAEPMLLMIDRAVHVAGAGEAGLGVVRGEKTVDPSEWFFKAHFFQDPVQPGSLGLEALLQLLQFYMLDTDMAAGVTEPRFEPLMLDAPMTWKYRGQVMPARGKIVTVMEIVEVGVDDRGPFVVGAGSLWCDELRIYEVSNMGMRVVSASTEQPATRLVEVAKADVAGAVRDFWVRRQRVPERWLGDDLISGLVEQYVNRVLVSGRETLDRLQGRSAIFLGNHQVQIESIVVGSILPALTGVPMTTVSNAKHERRWIGRLVDALETYPGSRASNAIAYFDQARPSSLLEIIAGARAHMSAGSHSLFVHTEGTRARSCREGVTRCSSVVLDLAVELGVPIVPVRFTGGLPVESIDGKAELPVGHGRQDYWIGEPIEAAELGAMRLRDRVDRVLSAINTLGVANDVEVPLPPDPELAARVERWRQQTGADEAFAAAWQVLDTADRPSEETQVLRAAARAGHYRSDGTPRGDWLATVAELFFGPRGPEVAKAGTAQPSSESASRTSIKVNRSSHPQLVDHAIGAKPVVPVAYALEWLARSAVAHAAPLHLLELADVRVLKGLVLDGYADGDDLDLVVTSSTLESSAHGSTLSLEIVEESTDRRHYRCTATLADRPPSATPGTTTADDFGAWTRPPYGTGVLFHGPAFQVIESVATVSTTGLVATVRGVVDRPWPAEPWVTDPALLDGALQMALLWTEQLLGKASLPTSIGRVRLFSGPSDAPCTATLRGRHATAQRVVCDVVLCDGTGAAVAELHGIETHVLPSKPTADPR